MNPQLQSDQAHERNTDTPVPPAPAEGADPFVELVAPPTAKAALPHSVVPFAPVEDFVSTYSLRENPFADCVHPAFFFRTDGHSEALRNMMLAAEFNTSLGMITGPSGTGKTLLSQMLLHHFDEPKYRAILVLVPPGLSKTGLLREIVAELGIALPVGNARVQDLVKLLSNHIIELHEQNVRLIIIIDECHLLSADCLHIIRTISNIEIPERKLVTCLLFGESRLAQRIEHPSYDSLRNRIYLRGELQPLSAAETGQYIKYRLMTVGRLTELFTEAAIEALHRHSEGIPRSVNKLAMLSLIEGAVRKAGMIDEPLVTAAAKHL